MINSPLRITMGKLRAIIVTLFDDNNIGNRLQNYAFQQILLKRNVDVTVLDNGHTDVPKFKEYIYIYIKGLLGGLGFQKYKKQFLKYKAEYTLRKVTNKIRNSNYKFDKNNIKNIIKVSYKDVFKKEWSAFDIAFAGSDQVWHKWHDNELELPYYYLEFLPETKRASYAASFGFEDFPIKDIKQHQIGIKGIKYISCRETKGCELASSVIGKNVEHVLDPTLLLTALEWRKLENQSSNFIEMQKNYAFVFFYCDITEEYDSFIKSTVKKHNITKIINPYVDGLSELNEFGPCEFLRLIDNAAYIFTDSFHCTVFSVLFEKDFTVFRRLQPGMEKMFGRIEDLLSSKGMLEHIYGGSSVEPTNNFEELKLRSLNYIDNVLRNIDYEKNKNN